MKRYLLFIIIGATLLGNTSSQAAGELGENGGLNSNPHNLSSLSSNAKKADTETQICIFCHTPHNAAPESTLWSRPDPQGMGSFPTLTSLPLKIDDPVAGGFNTTHYGDNTSGYEYPNGASKLCLSCHDGVTAMGILANNETIVMDTGGGDYAVAVTLNTSHPISFIYNTTVEAYLGDASYAVPSSTSGYLDGASRVQCTSCHQPHQDTMATNGLPFWREESIPYADDYNTVCDACHTAPPSTGGTGHTGYP